MKNSTVTSIVHHHIKEKKMEYFLLWLKDVRGASKEFEGYIDSKIIDSCGNKNEVISLFRFKTQADLKSWLDSKIHNDFLDELQLLVEQETNIKSYSGLEFWFDRTQLSKMQMSLITFIGLLPLVLYIPPLIEKTFEIKGFILVFISTAIIVFLMTYVVMPLMMSIINRINKNV